MKATSRTAVLTIALPAIVTLAVFGIVARLNGVTMDLVTRDVTAIAGVHPLAGILSSLGILLWCVAAAICLFVATTIRSRATSDVIKFLLASAALSAWLLFDDLFLIHDYLAAHYLGIHEKAIMLLLAVSSLVYLVVFRNIILRTDPLLMIAAFGFLSGSVVLDHLSEIINVSIGHWEYFIEDGMKWLGISFWCGFYISAARQLLDEAYQVPQQSAAPAPPPTH